MHDDRNHSGPTSGEDAVEDRSSPFGSGTLTFESLMGRISRPSLADKFVALTAEGPPLKGSERDLIRDGTFEMHEDLGAYSVRSGQTGFNFRFDVSSCEIARGRNNNVISILRLEQDGTETGAVIPPVDLITGERESERDGPLWEPEIFDRPGAAVLLVLSSKPGLLPSDLKSDNELKKTVVVLYSDEALKESVEHYLESFSEEPQRRYSHLATLVSREVYKVLEREHPGQDLSLIKINGLPRVV
ncbi:MAG: hypothetical protein D6719_03005, partial [Candidatus Dadabacteria bacterium]